MNKARAIYVHIPFCRNICYYCDFCRLVYREALVDRYLEVLGEEIAHVLPVNQQYDTIYIGGGTPSCLTVGQLEKLLLLLKPYAKTVVEYTIEFNPEDILPEKIVLLNQYGVNRVSIGVQSADNDILKYLNRQHNFQIVEKGIQLLNEKGIHNISIDLMYGLPQQSLLSWQETLKQVSELEISHISIYSLTIEPQSVFGKRNEKRANDDLDADMYEYAQKYLSEKGFGQYEVSNFSKPNHESLHNLAYWNYDDFFGIGASASGKSEFYRYTNSSTIGEYIKSYQNKIYYHLNFEDRMFEYVMMNLRKTAGFDANDFFDDFGIHFFERYKMVLKKLVSEKMIEIDNQHVRVTEKGLLLLNEILEQFLD